MAKLINGDGNKAIWAQQDADLIASLAGNVTALANVGSKFAATQEDANTIGLADGVIVTKEGRRIQLDVGNVDLFDIPTGTTGVTSYYIIGYHLYTESDSSQVCETFVQKMDNATDVITENTFRGGATEVYVSCYRVTQTGMNITSIDALLQNFKSLSEVMSALFGKPDYANTSSVSAVNTGTNIYTATADCLFNLTIINFSTGRTYLSILVDNKSVVSFGLAGAPSYGDSVAECVQLMLKKNDTVKSSITLNTNVFVNYTVTPLA